MSADDRRIRRFVAALLTGAEASPDANGLLRVRAEGRVATLPAATVAELIRQGVLRGAAGGCTAAPEAANWLKRQLLGADGFAGQHRETIRTSDGLVFNPEESP